MARGQTVEQDRAHGVDRTNRPIDLVHLARQTLGDRALECEVLRMFDSQLSVYFARVRETRDPEALAMGLHTLRGASLGIGATVLVQAVREAETELAKTGQVQSETRDDMAIAVAETSTYIARLLER